MRVLAVTNMYPTGATPAAGTFIEQQVKGLRMAGVEVEVFHVDRSGRGMAAYAAARHEVVDRARTFRPDVVHVMYGGVLADVVTRAVSDVPVIVSFCGSDLLGEHLSGRIRKVIAGYGVFSSRRAARRAAGIIVKSRNLQRALPTDRDRSRAHIIPNGVDLNRFRPMDRSECRRKLGWDQTGFDILFPANSGDPCKRLELACSAAEVLSRTRPKVRIRELRNVPHEEVPTWINASDMLILTSLHEGSPNVVKEALACDVPVVSVDVGDVRERLEGIEGCYLADATPEALAKSLDRVFDGPRRVNGRIHMRDLSLERVTERVRSCYADCIEAAG